MHFEKDEILITTGGSEALSIVFQCILDDGDEVLIPEPFYPNYSTMVYTTGASIHPIPTSRKRDTGMPTGRRSRPRSTNTPGPLCAPIPATPPAWSSPLRSSA